jgi:SET domain-containing protein
MPSKCTHGACTKCARRYHPFCSRHGIKHFGVAVKKSRILGSGMGLFAKRAIPPNKLIVEYSGTKVQLEIAHADTYISQYCLQLDDDFAVDAKEDVGNLGRFANDADHGSNPFVCNAQYVIKTKNGEKTAWIEAIDSIAVGEEIFVSYGEEFWDKHIS